MRKEGTGERDQSFREHRLRQFLLYLPPEGYTGLVPRFEIDGAEEGGGGRRGTGNDRSGVVKIERADSEPRELWRASELRRGEARRGESTRAIVAGRKYTDYSCSRRRATGCSKYGNRRSKSWPEGRRGRWRNSSNEDDPPSLRKPRSRNGGTLLFRAGTFCFIRYMYVYVGVGVEADSIKDLKRI